MSHHRSQAKSLNASASWRALGRLPRTVLQVRKGGVDAARSQGLVEWLMSLSLLLALIMGLYVCGYLGLHRLNHERVAWSKEQATLHGRSHLTPTSDTFQSHRVSQRPALSLPAIIHGAPMAFHTFSVAHAPLAQTTTSRAKVHLNGSMVAAFVPSSQESLPAVFHSQENLLLNDIPPGAQAELYQQALWAEALGRAGFSPPYLIDTLFMTELLR